MNFFKSHKKTAISILFPFLWICFISLTAGIHFETNDDRIFSELFSGAMTGFPEFRSYCVHPILGLFITFFYRLSTALPWYGLLLIVFQWICHAIFTYSVLSYYKLQAKTLSVKILSALLLSTYYAICFTLIAHIQFTSTAALLASTGYIQLFLTNCEFFSNPNCSVTNTSETYGIFPYHRISAVSVVLFFILQTLSYLLRSDSMLMIQPYGIMLLFTYALCGYFKMHTPELINFFFKIFSGVILLIFIGKGTHFLFFLEKGWNEYIHFSNARSKLFDYYGIPDYNSVQSILDKYDVSESQYLAFSQYTMLEPNLSKDCLSEISAYAESVQPIVSFSEIFTKLCEFYVNPEYYGIGKLLFILWFLIIIDTFLSKNYWNFLPLCSCYFTRTAIWIYLIYHRRTPFRVIYSLWIIEILLLLILLCHNFSFSQKSFRFTVLPIFLALFLGFSLIEIKQFAFLKQQNGSDRIYNNGYLELIEYCDNHPEDHYFLDAGTLLYYRGSAYTAKPFHPRNSFVTGCWYSGAPVLYERIAEYAPQGTTIYLIVSPDLPIQSEAVLDYFEEWRSTKAIYEESFTVSNGGVYEVYKF